MSVKTQKRIIREHLNPRFGYFYTVSRTLYRGRSKHQKIELVDTPEFGLTLRLDGITQVVTKNDYQYHEPMTHAALCCHPNPRSVLIIGGGDGGILRETVKNRLVRYIDVAELDEEVMKFSRRYFQTVHKGSFNDPRVNVHICDGRTFVQAQKAKYDVVIMDMTDPFGPSKYLYTKEFFSAVKRSLRDSNGVFTMHTESPVACPATFNCIIRTLRSVFPHVQTMYLYIQMYAVLWSISVCSSSPMVSKIKGRIIDNRLRKSGTGTLRLFTGETFEAMKVAYPYIKDELNSPGRILTDRRPDIPDSIFKRSPERN
jgi:spermidine synthase